MSIWASFFLELLSINSRLHGNTQNRMKKLFFAFAMLGLFAPTVDAYQNQDYYDMRHNFEKTYFRDVSPTSNLYPVLQWAVDEKEILDEGGFFRPDLSMPAQMFWPLVLKEAGFDEKSATFNTPLPVNIVDGDPLAQYLREGIRRGFISVDEEFDRSKDITQLEALGVLLETKAILVPTKTSAKFRYLFPKLPRRAKYLPMLEAAYASNMLTKYEVTNFKSTKAATREQIVTWLYRFEHEGAKKSSLEEDGAVPTVSSEEAREQRKNALQKRMEERNSEREVRPTSNAIRPNTTTRKPTTVKIEILKDQALPVQTNTISSKFNILEQVYSDVMNKFRFPEKITAEKKKEMIEAATEAMVDALDDKYTRYIKPSLSEDFQSGLNGEFEGIGAYIEMLDGKFTITAPITGSPAEEAGIKAGDVVTHVDGVSIKDEALSDSVNRIKGPAGTTVTLTIHRTTGILDITIVRGKITVPSVTLKWVRSVPILGVHQFNRMTAEDMVAKIEDIVLPKNPRGIVIDLRNNPGGFLTEAVEVGEIFLKQNDVVFSTEYQDREQKYKSAGTGVLSDMSKIIILQNKGTASASEILIKALQDYGRVKTIGQQTHGKGTVQSVSQYNNGGILKVTIAKWLSPDGDWLGGEGIIPDIEVPDPTVKDKQQHIDRQIDRAVQELLSW